MKNQAYINGLDLWLTYKANLVKGAYKDLMKLPNAKTWVSNKSRLEDGTRVAIPDGLRLAERDVKITFCVEGATAEQLAANYKALIKACTTDQLTLKVTRLAQTFHLVYKQMGTMKFYDNQLLRTVELTFTEPDPANRS